MSMVRFQIFFGFVIILNIFLWFSVRDVQARWENVPPAPSDLGAVSSGLGDKQLAYRMSGLMLQNLGNIGGRSVSFKKYDYAELEQWFRQMYMLDQKSNYVPVLAAYYYGATAEPSQIRHVIDFLKVIGMSNEGESWRWLTHGVFLARHKLQDLNKALELAALLKNHPKQDIPTWARHMDAMVYNAKGEKEDAYNILVAILQSAGDTMSPYEVRFIIDYICEQILTPEQVASDPICHSN